MFCIARYISIFLAEVCRKCVLKNIISKTWFIGFSEGATILAGSARYLNQQYGLKIAKAILLDPANPGYANACCCFGACSYILGSIAYCVVVIHSNPGIFGSPQIYTSCDGSCANVSDIQLVNDDLDYCWRACNLFLTCSPGCAHKTATVFIVNFVCHRRIIVSDPSTNTTLFISFYDCPPSGSYIAKESQYLEDKVYPNSVCNSSTVCPPSGSYFAKESQYLEDKAYPNGNSVGIDSGTGFRRSSSERLGTPSKFSVKHTTYTRYSRFLVYVTKKKKRSSILKIYSTIKS